ncbi:hypothetical protein DO70_3885 [Burkholderia pseudomallei]|nr:hypothetical protein DO70_3885 [Burkholderia pseudomallei]
MCYRRGVSVYRALRAPTKARRRFCALADHEQRTGSPCVAARHSIGAEGS